MPRIAKLFLLVPLLLAACGQPRSDSIALGPASMEDVLTRVEAAYEQDGNPPVRLSLAGTSTNARQIERGAPADLFLSADVKWMEQLSADGFVERESVRDIAAGQLVLIAPGRQGTERTSLTAADLIDFLGSEGRLAVADMKAVPAGRYAAEALGWIDAGPLLLNRTIETENVRGTLRLVETGEAAAGIVYATDAMISNDVHIIYRFPDAAHQPIRYQGGLLGKSPADNARSFLDYLGGKKARAIFAEYGFLPARTGN